MTLRARVLLLGVLAASATAAAGPGSSEVAFDRGYAAYEHGQWEEAARAFAEATAGGVQDPRVEYNLANAEFRRGRLGPAVLHWERALRLAPGDADVQANLDLARDRLVDRVEIPPAGPIVASLVRIQDTLGPDRQAAGLLVLSWAAAGILAWSLRRPGAFTPVLGWALAATLVSACVAAWSFSATLDRVEGGSGAIVMAPAVEVLAGPSPANATVFRIHEGTKVEIRDTRGDWMQAVLPNGLTGWVPRDAVEPI